MNYDEFQRQIGKAGLKLNEFAALMAMSHISISNYRKKGEVPRHLAVIAILLAEMVENGIDYRKAMSKIDATPKKPRGASIGKFGGTNT